jgi:pimeloyl-ACP methyl ester carboxylesterase
LSSSADQSHADVNFIRHWDAQIGALSEEHDVVVFDLPGDGLTPGTPQDWATNRLTDIEEESGLSRREEETKPDQTAPP